VGVILLLKTSDYLLSLDALARLLCPVRFQFLMLFLALVRAAHYWTETHPEIAFRPVQEYLRNVHRHSGSKTALIRLEREGNGSGTRVCATFPLKQRPSRDPSKTQQDVA
jgi:signal transduction histidine kinase